ncbi:MAG: hypothetical protein KC591_17105 [Gemmatimonadetes bacterium]|nr:hypothetical protein [Gemmatimonadota bacterium]
MSHRSPSRLNLLPWLLAGTLALPPAAHANHYFWASGVSGATDDATKWNPAGVPGWADWFRFTPSGTYTVTFGAGNPLSTGLVALAGNQTWKVNTPHTTGGLWVDFPNNTHSLTINAGSLTTDFVQFGAAGGFSQMTMTNSGALTSGATIHSQGINNPNGAFGDHLGHDGISEFNIYGGARYYSDQVGGSWPVMIGVQSTAAATVSVAGFSSLPTRYSGLVVGTNGLTVGVSGVGNLFATNGGFVDCAGPLLIAGNQTSSGYVNVGPVATIGTSYVNAQDDLLIGNNGIGDRSGHAELTVNNRAWVTAAGNTVIGDPDNLVDTQCVLRVREGGTFTAMDGIRVWPTSGVALDLQGGVTRITGGQLRWPASKTLTVSSTTGTPELWISNGDTNIAPTIVASQNQLLVGGTGTGHFHVTGAGTVFPMGPGATTIAQSAGSLGSVDVDGGAVLSSGGPFHVGSQGVGSLTIQNGSTVDVGYVQVAPGAAGNGTVHVSGSGSTLTARDNVYVGGGFGGAGGTGTVTVDDSGELRVLQTSINPALLTVHPSGTCEILSGGRIVTTGTLDDRGTVNLAGGVVEAGSLNLTSTGNLSGFGQMQLNFGVNTSGRIDPHAATDDVGAFVVTGWWSQFTSGHYVADLRDPGVGGCDLLAVSGVATLGGTLDLRTASGFVGIPGSSFTVLTCGSRTGTFASVTWNGAPLTDQANVVYESNAVRIVIPGDATDAPEIVDGIAELRFAPANDRGSLAFALELPEAATVRATLFDVRGRKVDDLADGPLAAGRHTLIATSRRLPAGAYFARAEVRMGAATSVRTAHKVWVR